MIRPVLAIALPVLLGGCATYYPPLYSAPSVSAKAPAGSTAFTSTCQGSTDPLDQTLACAEILQAIYSNSYEDSARWQDMSQLPLIGAAAASAWILLKDKDNAARKVGKIGIGALTYTAARDQLMPNALPETFIRGHSALGCVIAEKVYFRSDAAKEAFSELENSLKDTALFAVVASALRYTEPSDPTASPELLKAARTLADQAIAAANTQLSTSRKERAAYQFAASPFRQSVSDVAAWVASKGRARPNASYDDLLKSMSTSPKPDEPKSGDRVTASRATVTDRFMELADPSTPPTSAQLIKAIGEISQLLTTKTLILQGNTPAYGARLTKVSKCATDLPSG